MKHCPSCQTEYDDEVIAFCTKDGTPLVGSDQPVFTDKLPSEESDDTEDDFGAQTIVRRKPPTEPETPSPTPSPPAEEVKPKEDSQRIVISTDGVKSDQGVRPSKGIPRRLEPPTASNTVVIVLLTIIATVLVLLGAFSVYWMLTGNGAGDNSNLNVNENVDINGNSNISDNFNLEDLNLNLNSNTNSNFNLNSNSNFNLSTPSPSPSLSPSPTPSPSLTPTVSPTPGNTNSNFNIQPIPRTPRPTATPTVRPSPSKSATPSTNTNTTVNVGPINSRALSLPTPVYPSSARNARATGRVVVSVTIDANGNVIAARATKGHPLLRSSAERAARRSKFRPVSIRGRAVRANGTILYNFVN